MAAIDPAPAPVPEPVPPTQVVHPWRATARTMFAALIAFSAIWGVIVEALGLDPELRVVAWITVVTAGITRVMAIPSVEAFLTRFLPFLAASPKA